MDLLFLTDVSQDAGLNPMPFFHSSLFRGNLFLQLWLYGYSHASFQFSVRIIPHVDVFLMCL